MIISLKAQPPSPDWMADLYKENYFRIQDIRQFQISRTSNDDYIIYVKLDSGKSFILENFQSKEDAQNFIVKFIKDKM